MLPQSDYHKFGSKYAMAGTESYPPTDSEQVLIKRQLATVLPQFVYIVP